MVRVRKIAVLDVPPLSDSCRVYHLRLERVAWSVRAELAGARPKHWRCGLQLRWHPLPRYECFTDRPSTNACASLAWIGRSPGLSVSRGHLSCSPCISEAKRLSRASFVFEGAALDAEAPPEG